jgi:hypothetical protein
LSGEDGIERFPEALKRELQILTYEDWKGVHEPFDYIRHMLQVVAVDHIVQAAHVAFVDEAELAKLEAVFVVHARALADELRQEWLLPRRCLQMLQLKSAEELDPDFFQQSLGESRDGLTLLINPELREDVMARLGGSGQAIRLRDFDANRESLSAVVREALAALPGKLSAEARVSLVAPFYFIKRDGIRAEAFADGACHQGIKLFANNYTVQGVKIKGCKSVLNRVYCLLTHLQPATLASCPFLSQRDGIYVADLSLIPEKYRLDVQRAEKILNRCLLRWLETLQGLRRQA